MMKLANHQLEIEVALGIASWLRFLRRLIRPSGLARSTRYGPTRLSASRHTSFIAGSCPNITSCKFSGVKRSNGRTAWSS